MPENDEVLIAEFEKNARERVRVRLTEFRGIKLLDVRTFYEDSEGAWKPGKGLAIRRELIPELIEALQEAEKQSGISPSHGEDAPAGEPD